MRIWRTDNRKTDIFYGRRVVARGDPTLQVVIVDTLRTLAGAAPLQMPASIDLFADQELKDRFERWWGTARMPAMARYKLYKLYGI